jgi:hypothetical protein
MKIENYNTEEEKKLKNKIKEMIKNLLNIGNRK